MELTSEEKGILSFEIKDRIEKWEWAIKQPENPKYAEARRIMQVRLPKLKEIYEKIKEFEKDVKKE